MQIFVKTLTGASVARRRAVSRRLRRAARGADRVENAHEKAW